MCVFSQRSTRLEEVRSNGKPSPNKHRTAHRDFLVSKLLRVAVHHESTHQWYATVHLLASLDDTSSVIKRIISN